MRHPSATATLLVLVLWAGPLEARAQTGPVEVDRIEVVVADRVVTASDVRLEAALQPHHPSQIPAWERRRQDPLEAAVDQAVLRKAAGAVGVYLPSRAELRAELTQVIATWPDDRSLGRFMLLHGLDEESLSNHVYARMVAERFLLRNLARVGEGGSGPKNASDAEYRRLISELRTRTEVRYVHRSSTPASQQ